VDHWRGIAPSLQGHIMKVVEGIILAVAVALLVYGGYNVITAFVTGFACINGYCAKLGVLHQGFWPISMMYAALALIGFHFTKRGYKKLFRESAAESSS
jgi:hypothetical protein